MLGGSGDLVSLRTYTQNDYAGPRNKSKTRSTHFGGADRVAEAIKGILIKDDKERNILPS